MTAVVKSAVEKKEGKFVGGDGGGRRRKMGGGTATDGAVTRVVATTRTMTISFYFPHSLISFRLSTFISPVVLAISSIPGVHPLPLARRGGYLETPFAVVRKCT